MCAPGFATLQWIPFNSHASEALAFIGSQNVPNPIFSKMSLNMVLHPPLQLFNKIFFWKRVSFHSYCLICFAKNTYTLRCTLALPYVAFDFLDCLSYALGKRYVESQNSISHLHYLEWYLIWKTYSTKHYRLTIHEVCICIRTIFVYITCTRFTNSCDF